MFEVPLDNGLEKEILKDGGERRIYIPPFVHCASSRISRLEWMMN